MNLNTSAPLEYNPDGSMFYRTVPSKTNGSCVMTEKFERIFSVDNYS